MNKILRLRLLLLATVTLIECTLISGILRAGGNSKAPRFSSISGKVSDFNKNRKSLLPGVKAYLISDTLLVDSTEVSPSGEFHFDSLAKGSYDIAVRGANYFPVKILAANLREASEFKITPDIKLAVLKERYGPNGILNNTVSVYFKAFRSAEEFEQRIKILYGYEVYAMGTPGGIVRLIKLTTEDGSKVFGCQVVVPSGESPTSVTAKMITDPFVYRIEPNAATDFGPAHKLSTGK